MTESPKALEAEVEANRANVEGTLNALREKTSVEGVMRDLTRYVGIGDPRSSLEAAGREVNANPLAFGLIAAGVACLATGMTRRSTHPKYTRPYDGMNEEYIGETHAQSHSTSTSGIGSRISGYGSQLREGAGRGYGAATEAMHHARESVQGGYSTARDSASGLTQRASHQMTEQPLLFGAIALAAGAILGAALPTTRTENRWLGPSHDRLAESAREAASELKERAAAAAEAGLAAVSDTAEEEGLVPSKDKSLAERVQHVAEAAATEASETFKDPNRSHS